MTPCNRILLYLLGEFLTTLIHFLLVLREFLLTVCKWTVGIGALSVVNNSFAHVCFVLGMFYSVLVRGEVSLMVLIVMVSWPFILVVFLTIVFLVIIVAVFILLFLILRRPGIKVALGGYNLLNLFLRNSWGFLLLLIHIIYRLLSHLGRIRRLVIK